MNEYEPDYYNYEPEAPQRYHSTKDMPILPVSPIELSRQVIKKLEKYVAVPEKTSLMVEDMCRTFNECIRLNQPLKQSASVPFPSDATSIPKKDQYLPTTTLVCSPKTGSAKSLTAKVYASLLEKESSIIIVSTVDDAIEFCKDINEWSHDKNYARCYYSAFRENEPFHVAKSNLKKYRCIVITHSMFISANQNIYSISAYYQDKKRDLTIIDERLSLHNTMVLKSDEVDFLCDVMDKIQKHTTLDLKNTIDELNKAKQLFKLLDVYAMKNKTNHFFVNKSSKKTFPNPQLDHELLETIIYSSSIPIERIINACNPRESQTDHRNILNRKFDALTGILEYDYVFYREGKYSGIIRIDKIYNKFGSSVVLDATANVNEIYNTSTYHQHDSMMHLDIVDPRIYSNFTINKAVGYPQGATSIYKNANDKELNDMIKSLKRTINKILINDDKLLIVTFKDFRTELEDALGSEQIVFTHWGNYIGKNIWSDCNKVMIIGWNHKPKYVDYCNFVSSVGTTWLASNAIGDGSVIKDFHITSIADDIIQAIARCSVRKTISPDGNCSISEAYLFYPDDKQGRSVMSIVEAQFTSAAIKEWNPTNMSNQQKRRQSTKNIDSITSYLELSLEINDSIKLTDMVEYFVMESDKISKSALSRTVVTLEFLEHIQEKGYEKYMHNKKSYSFRKIK